MAQIDHPAAACNQTSCEGCEIQGELICYAMPADLVDFGLLVFGWLIPFTIGMIRGRYWLGLGIWLVLAAAFFTYIEAYVLCRHCPAYKEPGGTLRCHANWGLPKLPPYDPRPMARWEGFIFLGYVALLFTYQVPFFMASGQWVLLTWSVWSTVTAVWTVWRTQCNRCFMLSCPANHVPEDVREVFYRNYTEFQP